MTAAAPRGFVHRFVPASDADRTPLLLLHGTGGDEVDLLPIGARLSPGAALLSPRGKVLEAGMPRFFGRLAEGVFDLDEVRRRAIDLAGFVEEARGVYGMRAPLAVGYSNGANVAAAMLILRPGTLAGAVLLRPMAILDESAAELRGTAVLLLSGARDPIVPAGSVERLAAQLRAGGAAVEHVALPAGHQLTPSDLEAATTWVGGHESASRRSLM